MTGGVIVIGAGMAGLAAARMLTAAGIEVVLLEARDRVGGRTHTLEIGGAAVDVGAAWIHGRTGNPVGDLVDGLGISHQLHDYAVGRAFDAIEGRELTSADRLTASARVEGFWRELDRLRARLMSSASLQEGIDAYLSGLVLDNREERYARFMLEQLMCELDYAGPSAGKSLRTFGEEEWYGPDDHVLDGGYVTLVSRLASDLDVRLQQIVTTVAHDKDGVRVSTASGEVFEAQRVIVTVPVGVLRRETIVFEPALPEAKLEAISRFEMSSLEKVVLRFDDAFWPRQGQFAYLHIGVERGEFPAVYDFTFHAGVPTLVLMHGGRRVRDVLHSKDDATLVAEALAVVERVIGVSPPSPVASHVTRWRSDPFSLGSYSYPAVGLRFQDFEALATPIEERVFFAGEATSRDYFGTVHGALHSGIREAARLGGDLSGLPGL